MLPRSWNSKWIYSTSSICLIVRAPNIDALAHRKTAAKLNSKILEKSWTSLGDRTRFEINISALYNRIDLLNCLASEWNWMSSLKRCIISDSCSFSFTSSLSVLKLDCKSLATEMSTIRPSAITIMAMIDNVRLSVNIYWTAHASKYPSQLFVGKGNLKFGFEMHKKDWKLLQITQKEKIKLLLTTWEVAVSMHLRPT